MNRFVLGCTSLGSYTNFGKARRSTLLYRRQKDEASAAQRRVNPVLLGRGVVEAARRLLGISMAPLMERTVSVTQSAPLCASLVCCQPWEKYSDSHHRACSSPDPGDASKFGR